MHECQEIRSANINQKEDRFLIYERDLITIVSNMLIVSYKILRVILFKKSCGKKLATTFLFCTNREPYLELCILRISI